MIQIPITIFFACFLSLCNSWSLKIGNPLNSNIQTGQVQLFSNNLSFNTTSYFSIPYPAAVSASGFIQGGIGITSSKFSMNGMQFGWSFYVNSVNSTQMVVEAWAIAEHASLTISSTNVRYIVSSHPYIDIDYASIQTNGTILSNAALATANAQFIYRELTSTASYTSTKSGLLSVQVIAVISGFFISNMSYEDSQLGFPAEYFGLSVSPKHKNSSHIELKTRVYGLAEVANIKVYFLSYEKSSTNTQTSRTVSGVGSVGCYFDQSSCTNVSVLSNSSFSTTNTYIQTYYDDMFFMGLTKFIVFRPESNSAGSNISNCCGIDFAITGTHLNSDVYVNDFTFDGIDSDLYTFSFSYLIDLNFDCFPPEKYHQTDFIHCDSVCNGGVGQYPNTTDMICYKCHSLCYKCTGPTKFECTACKTSSHHRVLSSANTCLCESLYYYEDNVNDVCPSCHYSCLSCTFSTASDCTSCDALDLRYDNGAGSCPCKDGFFDNGAKKCVACFYSCKTCFGNQWFQCFTCPDNSVSHRTITFDNKCPCDTGYFSTSTTNCLPCLYSCTTCSVLANNCTSCLSSTKRTINVNVCECNTGFYDDGIQAVCQPCISTCKTCIGPTTTDCRTCFSSQNRKFQSSTSECLCIIGYYEFSGTCHLCHYSCQNCTSGSKFSCATCDPTKLRVRDSLTSQCLCEDGYYDDGINTLCSPCSYTCQKCSISSTNCTACNATQYRIMTGNQCPCKYGYVDDLLTGMCTKCHYSCESCSGILPTQCIDCDTAIRDFSGGKCLCKPGTFDDGLQKPCQLCNAKCKQCVNMYENSCTNCNALSLRAMILTAPNFCSCIDHYYDAGLPTCLICDSTCFKCQSSSSNCLSCYGTQFRSLYLNSCKCIEHYYDTGADTCLKCVDSCLNCSVLANNCTSCPALRTLFGNSCKCVSKYYENNATGNCDPCSLTCENCENSSTTCTKCYNNSFRTLSSSQCVCQYGYFDNLNPICAPCPYSCINCTAPGQCLECPSGSHRSLVPPGLCKCDAGYYDNGVSTVCPLCGSLCSQCTDLTVCTDCYPSQNRQLVVNSCLCKVGFYDNYPSNTVCQICHFSCSSCSSGTQYDCTVCAVNRVENTSTGACLCKDGFYQIAPSCYLCDADCLSCFGSANYCTSCYGTQVLVNGSCQCPSGSYKDTTGCQLCDPKCKQCLGASSFCTSCNPLHQTILTGNDCICNTSTYQDNTTLVCSFCSSNCLECTGPSSYECTSCDSNLFRVMSNNSFQCICVQGYYEAQSQCKKCDSRCSSCFGSSVYNCTACQTGYVLLGNYCRQLFNCTNYRYENNCLNECPKTTYPSLATHQCLQCENGCLYCLTPTFCLKCQPNLYYISNQSCSQSCPVGTYINPQKQCQNCPTNCAQCQQNSNEVICTVCQANRYLKEGKTCSEICPVPFYVPQGLLCFKCLGNCLKCDALSTSSCLQCIEGTLFLNKQCFNECPIGYYKEKKNCQVCPSSCLTCFANSCLSCQNGLYLLQNQCIEYGFYYDGATNKPCHPNCLSCTNSSFASCIQCRSYRGDSANLAIQGYCECHANSIDLGNGVCDEQKFQEILQSTQALVSASYSTLYLTGLTGLIATNYAGMIAIGGGYLQPYSQYYYLNASVVMQINVVLAEYNNLNINTYYNWNSNPGTSVLNQGRRNLLQIQSNQALFLRDTSYKYLIDWASLSVAIIIFTWSMILILYCFIKGCLLEKQQNARKKPMKKRGQFAITFYQVLYQTAPIVIQLVVSAEVTLYGIASFKILVKEGPGQQKINGLKLFGSAVLMLYIIGYTFRLLIGAFKHARHRQQQQDPLDPQQLHHKQPHPKQPHPKVKKSRTSIDALYHMHLPSKSKVTNAIYIPLLILRNQLTACLIVLTSQYASSQIISSGLVHLCFAVYSLCCCPYAGSIRIFVHLSQLTLLAQIVLLGVSTNTNYGDPFSPIQASNYRFAYALMFFNYFQIIIYIGFSLMLVFNFGKDKLCRSRNMIANEADIEKSRKEEVNETQQVWNERDKQANIFDERRKQSEEEFGGKF